MKDRSKEPCYSCKLISVGCFLGIGAYLVYQGKVQPKSKYIYYGLGAVSATLGVGEIFDKSPFRSVSSESNEKTN